MLTGVFIGLAIMLSGSGRILEELGSPALWPMGHGPAGGRITASGNQGTPSKSLLGAGPPCRMPCGPRPLGGNLGRRGHPFAQPSSLVARRPPLCPPTIRPGPSACRPALPMRSPQAGPLYGLWGFMGWGQPLESVHLDPPVDGQPLRRKASSTPQALGGPFGASYAFILWAAMLTTALANANALAGRLTFLEGPMAGAGFGVFAAAHPWTTGLLLPDCPLFTPVRVLGASSRFSSFSPC